MVQYLNRKQQAEYLRGRGLKISPAQLHKLGSKGGGPRYAIWGNQAVSTPEWLDEWVKQKLSPPRRSTSDRDQRASEGAA